MDSKEESMKHLETLKQIQRMVEQYLYPREYDTESIAVEIFFELWQKKMYVSNLVVKNRCIDEIRHKTCVKIEPIGDNDFPVPIEDVNLIARNPELLDILIRNARLTSEEKKMIYLAFYKNESVSAELLAKIIDKLRKEAELIKKDE